MRLVQAMVFLALAPLLSCEYPQASELFDVSATLEESTCGTGALDADDALDFQVRIERDDDILTWDDTDSDIRMQATIDDDEVILAASSVYEITSADDTTAGCTVVRRDRYEATIDGSGDYVDRMEGEVTFSFSEATGYDCEELIGTTHGFEDLPCTITYTFVVEPAD